MTKIMQIIATYYVTYCQHSRKCFADHAVAVWIARDRQRLGSKPVERRIDEILVYFRSRSIYVCWRWVQFIPWITFFFRFNQHGLFFCGIVGFVAGEVVFLVSLTLLSRKARSIKSTLGWSGFRDQHEKNCRTSSSIPVNLKKMLSINIVVKYALLCGSSQNIHIYLLA